MKGNAFDIETIEAFILNKLDKAESASFREALSKDPLLQQEFNVQKETIQSLQNFRKAELKARLNNIEVPSNKWQNASRLAASLFILASLSGVIFFFNSQEDTATNIPAPVTQLEEPAASDINDVKEENSSTEKFVEEEIIIPETSISSSPINNSTPSTQANSEKTEVEPIEIAVPEFEDSFDDTGDIDKSISLPDSKVAKIVDTKEKLDIELVDQEGEISYKYYNNKLFLYGKFTSDTYELLELNNFNQKELYLFFKGDFYKLQSNTFDVSKLKSINNQDLKNQLEEIRVK